MYRLGFCHWQPKENGIRSTKQTVLALHLVNLTCRKKKQASHGLIKLSRPSIEDGRDKETAEEDQRQEGENRRVGGTCDRFDIVAVTPQLTPAPDSERNGDWEERDVIVENEAISTNSSRGIEDRVPCRKGTGDCEKPCAHDQRQTRAQGLGSEALEPRGKSASGEGEAKSDKLQGIEEVGDGGGIACVGGKEGFASLEETVTTLGEEEMAMKDSGSGEDLLDAGEPVEGIRIVAGCQPNGARVDGMDMMSDAASEATDAGEEGKNNTLDADSAVQTLTREPNAKTEARGQQGAAHRGHHGRMEVLISDDSDGEAHDSWIDVLHQNGRRASSSSPAFASGTGGAVTVPGRITTGEGKIADDSEPKWTKWVVGKRWRRDSFEGGVRGDEAEPGGVVVELVRSSSSRGGTLPDDDASVVTADAVDADVDARVAEVARDHDDTAAGAGAGPGENVEQHADNEIKKEGEEQERKRAETEMQQETNEEERSTEMLEGKKDLTDAAEAQHAEWAGKELRNVFPGVPNASAAGGGTLSSAGEISGDVPQDGSRVKWAWVGGLEEGATEEPKPVSGGGRQLQPRPFTIFVSSKHEIVNCRAAENKFHVQVYFPWQFFTRCVYVHRLSRLAMCL